MDKRKMLIGSSALILFIIVGVFGYTYYQKTKLQREAKNVLEQLTSPASEEDIYATSEVKSTEAALTAPASTALSSQANDEKIDIIKQLSN